VNQKTEDHVEPSFGKRFQTCQKISKRVLNSESWQITKVVIYNQQHFSTGGFGSPVGS